MAACADLDLSQDVPSQQEVQHNNSDDDVQILGDMDAELDAFNATLTQAAKEATKHVHAAMEGARTPRPGMEAKTGALEAALSKGELELRSGLGQQFSAWLKSHPEEEKKYNAAAAVPGSKNAAKKAFSLTLGAYPARTRHQDEV